MSDLSNPDALAIPPAALTADDAFEVLRAWIAGDGLQVCMRMAFEDPGVWGQMLADIARHAARMYVREGGLTEAEAIDQIVEIWNAEMGDPTDPGITEPFSGVQ